MIRRPPRSTLSSSSAASDVYKRQRCDGRGFPKSPKVSKERPDRHEGYCNSYNLDIARDFFDSRSSQTISGHLLPVVLFEFWQLLNRRRDNFSIVFHPLAREFSKNRRLF